MNQIIQSATEESKEVNSLEGTREETEIQRGAAGEPQKNHRKATMAEKSQRIGKIPKRNHRRI